MHPSMLTMKPLAAISDHALDELVHELRQPLSNIGLSASYLSLILGENQSRAQQQILQIQEQVERAACILNGASALLSRARTETADCSDSNLAPGTKAAAATPTI